MQNHAKDNIIFFLVGVLFGIMTAVSGGIYVYKTLKAGKSDSAPIAEEKKASAKPLFGRSANLYLGFENPSDKNFFSGAENATLEVSDAHPTSGSHSLQIMLPAGASYPGIEWEVYGREALNWKGKSSFSIDIYNNTEDIIPIEVKFKSGKNYPKKSFTLPFTLDPLKENHIDIDLDQLGDAIDLSQVSYIKVFAKSPSTDYYLYFDEIKLK